jgi:GNAT superfamily N-acetyltransferase
MKLRPATDGDVAAIAATHAQSWKNSYRGVYPDSYLDTDVDDERLAAWTEPFANKRADQRTILAEDDGVLAGFAHLYLDEDETHGALVDNLHVLAAWQGTGLGRRLLAASARIVLDERPGRGLHLWVLEPNAKARGFYAALGGRETDRVIDDSFEDVTMTVVRVVWPDPAALLP